jgi:RHS repeat-associated protein
MIMLRGADGRVVREFRSLEYQDGQGGTGSCPSYQDYFWAGLQQRAFDDGSGTIQHVHLDHLGNPRIVTSGLGIEGTESFAPWGQVIGNPIDMRIGFTGHEKDRNGEGASTTEDALTESYNFGARSYLPNLGRFSTPGPARDPSSWSLYGYAGGSPMMFVDPDGLRIVVVGGKKKREAVLQLFRDALDEAGAGEAAEALEIKKIDGQFVITAGGANLEDSDNSTVKLIGSAMNVEDNIAVRRLCKMNWTYESTSAIVFWYGWRGAGSKVPAACGAA